MSPEEIELVQSSWEKVKPISEQAAELFYGKLFELDPSLKPLFKGDMKEQGKKLMATLNLAVVSLTKLEEILPAVQDLGRRHVKYGVPDESYQTVAQALLWTLEQGLGDGFTPEVKAAWTKTYVTLSNVMLEAAHEGDQPASAAG
ncbi:globin domain-containing protein [Stieleria sp. JC731]|uniref:globin family protein n=1 Tax=Pirellulaceae TaxID=2691357 RepID=UPI001E59DC08|nr:globin family protein [Stieleria sp. JC731]MCC9600671.1 globin domain-containing protein [Stieleria sp. JC731]